MTDLPCTGLAAGRARPPKTPAAAPQRTQHTNCTQNTCPDHSRLTSLELTRYINESSSTGAKEQLMGQQGHNDHKAQRRQRKSGPRLPAPNPPAAAPLQAPAHHNNRRSPGSDKGVGIQNCTLQRTSPEQTNMQEPDRRRRPGNQARDAWDKARSKGGVHNKERKALTGLCPRQSRCSAFALASLHGTTTQKSEPKLDQAMIVTGFPTHEGPQGPTDQQRIDATTRWVQPRRNACHDPQLSKFRLSQRRPHTDPSESAFLAMLENQRPQPKPT